MIITAAGDSLTAGFGVSVNEAYPAILERNLIQLGHDVTVINAGINGETSTDLLTRIPLLITTEADIFIIEIGTNDGLLAHPPALLEKNLLSIMDTLHTSHITPVLTGMIAFWEQETTPYTRAFEAVFPRVACMKNVIFMDFLLQGVALQPELNQPDQIHPLASGYDIIARNLVPFVVEAIQRIKQSRQQE